MNYPKFYRRWLFAQGAVRFLSWTVAFMGAGFYILNAIRPAFWSFFGTWILAMSDGAFAAGGKNIIQQWERARGKEEETNHSS